MVGKNEFSKRIRSLVGLVISIRSVLWVIVIGVVWLFGYKIGYEQAYIGPKTCPKLDKWIVISSTPDICNYAKKNGIATYRKKIN